MMLLPSNRCVHRRFMLRAFTSRISSSGGSGGSWGDTGRLRMTGGEALPERGGPRSEALCPRGTSTLDGELDQASVLAVGVDGVTGEEDRVPAVSWFQLRTFQGEKRSQFGPSYPKHRAPAFPQCCSLLPALAPAGAVPVGQVTLQTPGPPARGKFVLGDISGAAKLLHNQSLWCRQLRSCAQHRGWPPQADAGWVLIGVTNVGSPDPRAGPGQR